MDIPLNWKPEGLLLEKLLILARQSARTLEGIIIEILAYSKVLPI